MLWGWKATGHPESSAHTSSFLPSSYNYNRNVVSKRSWKWKVKVSQSCLTLWDPKDSSMPGSSVHGKNIGVGSHSLLQGIFPTQGLEPGLLHRRRTLRHLNLQETALNDLPNEMHFPSFHYSLLKFYFVSDTVLHSHFSQMERQSTSISWETYKLPERRKSMFSTTLLKKLLQTSLPRVVSSEKTADKSSITAQDCFKGVTDFQERPLPFHGRSLHHTNTSHFPTGLRHSFTDSRCFTHSRRSTVTVNKYVNITLC